LYGEKDGVLLAHPSIVLEATRQIRKAIIEISKEVESKRDRESKESTLYNYIKSQEFTRTLENLYGIHQLMAQLQDKEEKAHERLWRERKELQSKINQTYMTVSNAVESILQEKPPMAELIQVDTQEEAQTPKQLPVPLIIKRRKKKTTQDEDTASD